MSLQARGSGPKISGESRIPASAPAERGGTAVRAYTSRREARFSGEDLVLLADQDRSLWNTGQIEDGRAVLDRALALRGRGPYVLQGAIASLPTEDRVDWPQIAAL